MTLGSVERGVVDISPFSYSLRTHESLLVSIIPARNCTWNYGEQRHLSRIMICIRLITSPKVIFTLIIINMFMGKNKILQEAFSSVRCAYLELLYHSIEIIDASMNSLSYMM